MIDAILGALLIMAFRISDVSIGTFRMIMVVQAKKYIAAALGFFEVLIWLIAMRFVFQNLDSYANLIGYAMGFAIGNIIGITLEEKLAIGYIQVNVISRKKSKEIAQRLRESKFAVTILPGEGASGTVNVEILIIKRKNLKAVRSIIESVDKECFITIQHSRPYRGFIHGSRK